MLATFFVLLPSFVFVIGGPHYVEKVRDNRTIQAFIAGVSAAVLRGTDSKSVAPVLTSFYCALPSSIYRRFSRQSKLRLAWYRHVTPHLPLMFLGHRAPSRPLESADIMRRT